MSSIPHRALVALLFLSCAAAHAAPYPTANELRSAIEVAAQVTQMDGLSLHMEDAREAGVTLPLMAAGLNLSSGVCQIYYNPAPEAGLAQFFADVNAKDMPVWLSAIAVHEATHCIEQREGYVRGRFDKVLPPGVGREGMTVKAYLGVVKTGALENWGEALADIASVLYLQRAAPDQWLNFAQAIISMRHRLAAKWPSHDTSPWLKKLIAARDDPSRQSSCFEAAFRLRRMLQSQLASAGSSPDEAPVRTPVLASAPAPVTLTGSR